MATSLNFHALVSQAAAQRASDIHLHVDSVPYFRVDGEIVMAGSDPVTDENLDQVISLVCDEEAEKVLHGPAGAIDRAYTVPGECRLRVSVARSLEGRRIVARLIPEQIPDIDAFNMPEILKSVAMEKSGFVLVGGATGSGKSTTIAAMIQHANRYSRRHVVTVEDPIEFVHTPDRCIFTRREIHQHLDSFANGLRSALRQDPDIILVGEMRDRETMRAAIQAAETGHLVFATVHASEVDDMPERVIGSFPEREQSQIRQQLAGVGLAFIAQTLPKRASGQGRVAAYEILILNNAARNLIRQEKSHNLPNIMQTSAAQGMVTMTQYLIDLYNKDLIDAQALVQGARNKEVARKIVAQRSGTIPHASLVDN